MIKKLIDMSLENYLVRKNKELKRSETEIRQFASNFLDISKTKIRSIKLSKNEILKLDQAFIKWNKGTPENYIYGYKYFLGNKFFINKNVLIPRNETEQFTETLISEINSFFQKTNLKIVEIGTGSGVIAISLSKNLSHKCNIMAVDISSKALKVAQKNINKLKSKNVETIKSNLFQKIPNAIDVIISNPPYIKKGDKDLDESVKIYEPSLSLYAKKNGLFLIKKIIKQSSTKTNEKWMIGLEFGWKQKNEVEKYISKYLQNMTYNFYKDYSNNWRFVIIKGDKKWE